MQYRIERIANGYVLYVTSALLGDGHDVQKFAFLTKKELLEHLEDVL